MNNTFIPLGIDAGNGAFKLYGAPGGLELVSQVATNGTQKVLSTLGLRKSKAPLAIHNESGSFYVGTGAHDFGRSVENLDVDRFNGTPEMKALLHGSLTRYQQRYGKFNAPLSVVVGLPNEALTGDLAEQNIENVKRWVRGTHTWSTDGEPFSVEIADVKAASQVTGGLFDYLLDGEGRFISERKGAFNSEVGIITIGFGTVELMAVRNREIVQRFTSGAASGVRRLLELINGQRLYSLGEMDMQLRTGQLDISTALPVWEREVTGVIEKQWGTAWKRFAAVLIMGGGAILLKDSLPHRFNGRAYMPDEPVQAIARGLYRLTLLQQNRKGK
ncbi:MAG: ParM/StbA family protein [Chloroflexi bacterium]|nr:ParM/StbA family protein [Chloroflexota bacterium]